MNEIPKSMRGEECFFDDGDDKILGRVDEGENYAEAYDLEAVRLIFLFGI